MQASSSFFRFTICVGLLLTLIKGPALLESHDDASVNLRDGRRLLQMVPEKSPGVTYAKTFVGIISSDSFNGNTYRKRHRELFRIWNDKRVCMLEDYRSSNSAEREKCEFIWTFILGGNEDKDGPTEIVDNSTELLLKKPIKCFKEDINGPDTSILNIRENMNEGKSQTFLYYATVIMEEFGFDYAMKLDADAMLHLHEFFHFSHTNLPPAPYNTNILAGAMRDKAYWPKPEPSEMSRKEGFFGSEFEGVHLYMAGQMYLLSYDLAKFVAQEAPASRHRIAEGGYLEGHEDHDISAMAFHSETPVHVVTIGKSQRFWEHPVKGQRRWERIASRETTRMSGKKWEGRILPVY